MTKLSTSIVIKIKKIFEKNKDFEKKIILKSAIITSNGNTFQDKLCHFKWGLIFCFLNEFSLVLFPL